MFLVTAAALAGYPSVLACAGSSVSSARLGLRMKLAIALKNYPLAVGILKPKLDTLPPRQRLVWERLGSTPRDFVLYGGTGLAVRLGHRQSVDFDFFSCRPFQPLELFRSISYLKDCSITQQAESTLSCNIETNEGAVKISFFGDLSLRQIATPDLVESSGIPVASLMDLFGTKCATVTQRNEVKDYLDIHALLTKGMLALPEGIAAARAIYGRQYDPLMTLQALSYFEDLREALDGTLKSMLLAAVSQVSVQDLPAVTARNAIGAGLEGAPS
jgi:hypothetical protein